MKRIQFISRLMALAGSGWLGPKLFSILTRRKTFTLYEGWIAGYRHYDGPNIEDDLNPADPWSCAVNRKTSTMKWL